MSNLVNVNLLKEIKLRSPLNQFMLK